MSVALLLSLSIYVLLQIEEVYMRLLPVAVGSMGAQASAAVLVIVLCCSGVLKKDWLFADCRLRASLFAGDKGKAISD